MNLYLLTQNENSGYDTYDSCVVVARSASKAKQISPAAVDGVWPSSYSSWASSKEYVTAVYLGKASNAFNEGDIICASFNAG